MRKSAWKRVLVVGAFTLVVLCGSLTASADVMPDCAEGQQLETNPVGPDETHHAGGRCVGEPTGCAAAPGAGAPGGAALCLLAVAALGVRRRRRRSAAGGRS